MIPRWGKALLLGALLLGGTLLLAQSGQRSAGLQALELGDRLNVEGQRTAAEAAYLQAEAQLADAYEPPLRLARLYYDWQRPIDGLAALREAIRRKAPREELFALQLALLLQAGENDTAASLAQAQLQTYPEDIDALATLTTVALRRGDCVTAGASAARWASAAPDNADAQSIREALAASTTRDAREDLALGQTLAREQNWTLAVCVLQRAVAGAPTLAEAHAWLGEALSRTGAVDAAAQHLEEATALAPDSPLGWLLWGMHALRRGDAGQAHIALERAHTLDPANPAPCLGLAAVAALDGHYEDADPWIEAALLNAPEDADVWKSAARFYLERGLIQGEEPLHAAEGALRLAPSDPEAQLLLGWTYLLLGLPDAALPSLEAAATFPQSHYLRGLALQALGRNDEAQAAFLRAADLGFMETVDGRR